MCIRDRFLAEDAVAPQSGEVLAEAADEITPGLLERMREAGIKRLSVLHTCLLYTSMEAGLRFAIREGGRTVGSGVVTEIIE